MNSRRSTPLNALATALILMSLVCVSCEEDNTAYDKVERLMITQSNGLLLASNDTSAMFLGYLTAFNIKDYKDLDSVKFVAIGGCNGVADKVYRVSLFDLTNGEIISGSEVDVETDECTVNKYSNNVKDKFPTETIDIGIVTNGTGSLWGSYL